MDSITALDDSKSKYQQSSLPESLTDIESNNGDTIITLGYQPGSGPTKKSKTEQNLRRKQSLSNDNSLGVFIRNIHFIIFKSYLNIEINKLKYAFLKNMHIY